MSVPTGSIVWSITLSPPEGFLLCNGQTVTSGSHPALYNLLVSAGNPYGTSGGNPKIPDLLTDNLFVRAAGGSVGVGTMQDYAIVNHSHAVSPSAQPGGGGFSVPGSPGGGGGTHNLQYYPGVASEFTSGGAGEARPVNIGLLPCIAT